MQSAIVIRSEWGSPVILVGDATGQESIHSPRLRVRRARKAGHLLQRC